MLLLQHVGCFLPHFINTMPHLLKVLKRLDLKAYLKPESGFLLLDIELYLFPQNRPFLYFAPVNTQWNELTAWVDNFIQITIHPMPWVGAIFSEIHNSLLILISLCLAFWLGVIKKQKLCGIFRVDCAIR